jgi:hypothetical protein
MWMNDIIWDALGTSENPESLLRACLQVSAFIAKKKKKKKTQAQKGRQAMITVSE